MKVEFTITDEAQEKFLRKYQEILQDRAAEGEKVTLSDTAKKIFGTGVPRLMATTKYALRKAGKLAPYKKPEKKAKPAKAPRVKKAAKPAKAKGPLARKAASKAKPPRVRKAAPPVAPTAAPEPAAPAAAPEPVLD